MRTFKQLLSSFQRNRDLVSVGAYAKGSDPIAETIALWPQLEGYLHNKAFFERADWEASLEGWSVFSPTVS
ncbi:hypothetical protein DMI70_17680 [Escherichia coli]|nr:hypothetical protein [Escherichia coli]